MIYGLSQIPDLLDSIGADNSGFSGLAKGFIRVAILIGLLQLVKKLPEIINKIFGTNIENKEGGISGRLGEMAGVGGIAKNAWDFLRHHPVQAVGRPVGAVLGAGSGIISRGVGGFRSSYQNTAGRHMHPGWRIARAVGAGIRDTAGGVLASPGSMRRGWRNGFAAAGREAAYYRDTHQEGSTFGGRLAAGAARTFGFRTPYERASKDDDTVTYIEYQRDAAGNIMYDANGRAIVAARHQMTVEQLNGLKSSNEAIVNQRNTARDAAVHAITDENSHLQLTGAAATASMNNVIAHLTARLAATTDAAEQARLQAAINDETHRRADFTNATATLNALTGGRALTYQQIQQLIEDESNRQLVQQTGESAAAFEARQRAKQQQVTEYSEALTQMMELMRDNILNIGMLDNEQFADTELRALDVSGRDRNIMGTAKHTLESMGQHFDGADQGLNQVYGAAQGALNDINAAAEAKQQQIAQRRNSPQNRQRQASQGSVDAARNNSGGSGGGGNS